MERKALMIAAALALSACQSTEAPDGNADPDRRTPLGQAAETGLPRINREAGDSLRRA